MLPELRLLISCSLAIAFFCLPWRAVMAKMMATSQCKNDQK